MSEPSKDFTAPGDVIADLSEHDLDNDTETPHEIAANAKPDKPDSRPENHLHKYRSLINLIMSNNGEIFAIVEQVSNEKFHAMGGEASGVSPKNVLNSARFRFINSLVREAKRESVSDPDSRAMKAVSKVAYVAATPKDVEASLGSLKKKYANALNEWCLEKVKKQREGITNDLSKKEFDSSDKLRTMRREKQKTKEIDGEDDVKHPRGKRVKHTSVKNEDGGAESSDRTVTYNEDDKSLLHTTGTTPQKKQLRHNQRKSNIVNDNASRRIALSLLKLYSPYDEKNAPLYDVIKGLASSASSHEREAAQACVHDIVSLLPPRCTPV